MSSSSKKLESADLFPDADCQRILSQLSFWTNVDDCLAAARFLEDRSLPEDSLSYNLVMPYVDSDQFEGVFKECLHHFIKGFEVPPMKIRLAALIDPRITQATRQKLREARFRPNAKTGPAGAIGAMYPQMADRKDERFMVIEDEPHIIELVQNPLRCLMDLLTLSWPLASEMRAVRELAKETGGAPTIFHQPYTDGPIPALTEAINFYVNQLEVGPRYSAHQQGFNQGYRRCGHKRQRQALA